jgi:hypothetical protein
MFLQSEKQQKRCQEIFMGHKSQHRIDAPSSVLPDNILNKQQKLDGDGYRKVPVHPFIIV